MQQGGVRCGVCVVCGVCGMCSVCCVCGVWWLWCVWCVGCVHTGAVCVCVYIYIYYFLKILYIPTVAAYTSDSPLLHSSPSPPTLTPPPPFPPPSLLPSPSLLPRTLCSRSVRHPPPSLPFHSHITDTCMVILRYAYGAVQIHVR